MTDDERRILEFEESHPRYDRRKEGDIRSELSMSWVRYRQVLLGLVGRQDVVAEFPIVTRRVVEATAAAVARRAARRF
ncbi:DUF3263 domain-containing protein [Curtobacterium sp. MCBA15_004]|uniref:DUF3263 domain-containing protein n=1 Tax=Curtobacterium sp. MCBA15_004 TaxID=1898733 RepID=UPI0008DD8F40|nr:DUF3263 domain-containing protein [Curtobacterium sp. MCBA15_004]WIA96425.1 DUF3263 domain-containing protein [Curtobacterium sp. MCBA15_004]